MMKNFNTSTSPGATSEKNIERHLVSLAARAGWLCLKYSNPIQTGYPDRIILLPGGRVVWVELKSTGQRPRPLQRLRHDDLRRRGHEVYVIDSREGVESLIAKLEERYAV